MGLKDMIQAIREYPTAHADLEAVRLELRQARTALEKSELECQRLSGDCGEARCRADFSEKKSSALQAALDVFCPKLESLAEMMKFYELISPSLDPQGFTLYHTAEKTTGIDLYSYFAYEDSRGMFETMNGRRLLRWLTAARFGAVEWEIVTGTCYEKALLREADTSTPEYQTFECELYRKVLDRMGFGDLLAPEEPVKSQEKGVTQTEDKNTELKLYSPLFAELFEADPEEEPGCGSQILTGENLTGFQSVIRQGIEDERMPEEAERGLMTYFDGSEAVDEKVASINIDVEEVGGELFGVAVCRVKGSLSPGELEELKEFCTGQYSDGWGEGYEQRSRKTDYLYDALNITVLDRMDKPIGTVLLKFQDVWGKQIVPGMPDCPDGIAPHIWTSRGKTEWHGWRPTPADREILRQQIRQSMKPFRDLAAERSPAQDQGIPVAFEQEAPLVRPAPQAVRLEREPGAMSGKWKDALQKRLEENYAAYTAQLTWKSFADLIEIADEIAAAKFVCENLASICTDSDAALLLRFDDPLELMRDRWLEETRVDHSEEIRHTIWTVRDRIEDALPSFCCLPILLDMAGGIGYDVGYKTMRRYQNERENFL